MADPLETVTVVVGGVAFGGWSSVSISYSVEQAARTASLVISDFGGALQMRPGAEAQVLASGEAIVTGYVRDVRPSHDANRHSVSISIASKTVDLVEASIDHATGEVRDMDLQRIAEAFDTSGVGVEVQGDYRREPVRRVNAGESWFYHIEPLARSYQAFIYDTPEGTAIIAQKPTGRHAGALSIGDGGNILSASATLTEEGRFDPVKAKGQSSKGSGAGALRIEAQASDAGVGRVRPKIIVHESEATSGKLQNRVEREVKRAAGYSRAAQVTVKGWRDAGGTIFTPHWLIAVADDRIYIDQDMAIQSVTLTQTIEAGGQGTVAQLSLVDPRALGGESGGGSSDPVWSTPDSEPVLGAA